MQLHKALAFLLCSLTPLVVWATRDTMPSGYATITDEYLVGVSIVNLTLLAASVWLLQHPNSVRLWLLNTVSILSAFFCLAATSYDECLDVGIARVDLILTTHLEQTLRGEAAGYVMSGTFIIMLCLEVVLLWQYLVPWVRRYLQKPSPTSR